MNADIEFWALAISVAVAVIPWAFSLHAKVAVIASSVEALPRIVDEIREVLQEHEEQLAEHAQAIEAIQKATSDGG